MHCAGALESLGMKAFVSHQPVISDGQTMGTQGKRVHKRLDVSLTGCGLS
jgi:hypothetical protein